MTYDSILNDFRTRPLPKMTLALILVNIVFFALMQYQPQGKIITATNINSCIDEKFPECVTRVLSIYNSKNCDGHNMFDPPCRYIRIVNNACLISGGITSVCYSQQDARYIYLGFTPAIFQSTGNIYAFVTAMFLQKNVLSLLFNILCFFFVARLIERKIGGLAVFLIYIVSSVVACILYYLFLSTNFTPIMGMSAAIFTSVGIYFALESALSIYYTIAILLFLTLIGALLNGTSIERYLSYLSVFLIGFLLTRFLMHIKERKLF